MSAQLEQQIYQIIYRNLHLSSKPRNTLWRLNIVILDNKSIVEEIKKEIGERINDKNDQINPTVIWDTVKAVMNIKNNSLKENPEIKDGQLEKESEKLQKRQPKKVSDWQFLV